MKVHLSHHLLLIIAVTASSAIAQDSERKPEPPPVEVLKQPTCPLKLSAGGGGNNVSFFIKNESQKPITAYVVYFQNPIQSFVHVEISSRGAADQPRRHSSVPRWAGTTYVSIDYILFADGKKWGGDYNGKAEDITQWLRGRDAAIDRLDAINYGATQWIYSKAVRNDPVLSISEPVPAAPGSPKTNYWNMGYETTVDVIPTTKESIPYKERLLTLPRG